MAISSIQLSARSLSRPDRYRGARPRKRKRERERGSIEESNRVRKGFEATRIPRGAKSLAILG